MNLVETKENVPGTILKYAVPSIIAMIITTSITIVDGLFIGNFIGKEAIAAVNLGLPILYLFLGAGIMIGVGGSSIAARLLGAGQPEQSRAVFNQTMLTTVITLIALSLVFLPVLKPLAGLFIEDRAVKSFFVSYYFLMLFAYPVMVSNTNFGMFIRAEGRPEVFMIVTLVTVVFNVVFDYIFLAVLGLGMEGVAWASIISVTAGLLSILFYFKTKSRVFRFGRFRFSKEVFSNSVINGSSELIGQLSMSITMLAMNYVILKQVGVTGLAAFTVVGYVSFLFSMIVIGFGQGASPVLSFSFGAGEHELSRRVRNATMVFVFILGVATVIVLNLAAGGYSNLFVKNTAVQELVKEGAPVFAVAFLFMGFNTIASFFFTSIGRAKESAVISAARGLVVLLACIFILPALFGMTGVWMVAPVTELMTLALSVLFITRYDQKRKQASEN